jgi:hypothetical protein
LKLLYFTIFLVNKIVTCEISIYFLVVAISIIKKKVLFNLKIARKKSFLTFSNWVNNHFKSWFQYAQLDYCLCHLIRYWTFWILNHATNFGNEFFLQQIFKLICSNEHLLSRSLENILIEFWSFTKVYTIGEEKFFEI